MKHAIHHIHFVGIGGVGMSGIAEVLLNLGYTISGSDLADSATLRRLAGLGIHTYVGHDAANIAGADAVVTSTAVRGGSNPEVMAARAKKIPVVPRALMLAELMRLKQGIAIAGTHGKTTTTSLVASVLAAAGLDPTFVIGGRLNSAGANAQLGSGDYIVVEADESDASFLNLLPIMAVVTNIDADHMETYGHDFGKLKKAFVDFLHRMPFYGVAILCTDDPAVREIVPEVSCPVTSYGFNEGAQVRAINVRAVGGQMHFTVQRRNGVTLPDLDIVLNLPGEHNVLNALSVIAVGVELNVPDEAVQRGLAEFTGVGRRFQRYGDVAVQGEQSDGGFTLIDDYGHHPVEMAATIAAARGAFPGRRLVLAFQPHRFTRTRDCFEDFVKVIGTADAVLLGEVYAAGEQPIVAADGRSLARALRVSGKVEPVFVDDIAAMPQAILDNARDGDVVICMGAGSIGAVPARVVELGGMASQRPERLLREGRAL
ncbi:UDP-N-acetylmuramate--L-alanine ligase [Variovorax humicola]|uniref:UDP-N-acetylmuramate--L-alanine ligase n=1 Tax=Variovorax humicola TaxID=1769758 RepID=A0ABU8VRP4_9BURK